MKILEQENRKAYKAMSTDYVFDKLNKLEDVIAIAKSLEASGVNITGILVSELGDYEDAPLRRGYPSIEEMSEVLNDFKGKVIEEYLINGEYEETLVSASIFNALTFVFFFSTGLFSTTKLCVLSL